MTDMDQEHNIVIQSDSVVERTNPFIDQEHNIIESDTFETLHPCIHCDKSFKKKSLLLRHILSHTGEKPFKCSQCDKTFTQKTSLNRHLKVHTGEKAFKCSQCNKAFAIKSNYESHIITHIGEKSFNCSQYDKCFTQTDHLDSAKIWNNIDQEHNIVVQHESVVKRTNPCIDQEHNILESETVETPELQRHILAGTGEKPFKCNQCAKSFTLKHNLNRHLRAHTGENAFKCSQCDKTFTLKSNYDHHIITHSGEKTFKCSQCDKTFTKIDYLHKHLRVHTEEKYKCIHCAKLFSRQDNLERHIKEKHIRENPYQCSQCDKTFTKIDNLNKHLRVHTEEKYKCIHCAKLFSRPDNLERHIKEKHIRENPYQCSQFDKTFTQSDFLDSHQREHRETVDETVDGSVLKKKTKCMSPNCKETFFHHNKLIQHLKNDHKAKIQESQMDFPSMKEFLTWKEAEESKNFLYYSKSTSTKKCKNDSYSYYLCQKNGCSRPHRSKDNRSRKTTRRNVKGVIKTDSFCPSRIICRANKNGTISITYTETHNHTPQFKDTEHHPIPESILENIKQKLLLGASVDHIHKDLREGRDSRTNRGKCDNIKKKHALSKRQIRNIARKLKVNKRLHANDAMSVDYITRNLCKEDDSFNPVLIYKAQGQLDFKVSPPDPSRYKVHKDDFLLGIQTKEQFEMFQKLGSKIVFLDSTHSTNRYKFKLINLVVQDEFNRGYVVGHLISNKEDEKSLFYFFDAIKHKCNADFKVNALMTDDDNAEWSAFKKVFGENVNHLLCHWHIKRSWRRKLNNLHRNDPELQAELFKNSVVLMEEPNLNHFNFMVDVFKKKYKNISEKYVDYFSENYLNRSKVWAKCFRQFDHGKSDTNMYVESFHNRLKTYYMKRRANRRIDDLLILLLDIEADDYWRHYIDVKSERKENPQKKNSSHVRGMKIDDNDVQKVSEYLWMVKSQSVTNKEDVEMYKVNFVNEECFNDICYNECREVSCIGLCSHMYKCSCEDENSLCKHIHKIHSSRVQNYQAPGYIVTESQDDYYNDFTHDDAPLSFHQPDNIVGRDYEMKVSESKLKRAFMSLEKITVLLEDENVKSRALSYICSTLEQLTMYCEAMKSPCQIDESSTVPQFEETSVPPNQKLDTQLTSFYRTQKINRKPSQPIRNPSAKEKKDIKEKLMTESTTVNSEFASEDISSEITSLEGTSDMANSPNLSETCSIGAKKRKILAKSCEKENPNYGEKKPRKRRRTSKQKVYKQTEIMRPSSFLNSNSQSKNILQKMIDEQVSSNSMDGANDQVLPTKTIAITQQNIIDRLIPSNSCDGYGEILPTDTIAITPLSEWNVIENSSEICFEREIDVT